MVLEKQAQKKLTNSDKLISQGLTPALNYDRAYGSRQEAHKNGWLAVHPPQILVSFLMGFNPQEEVKNEWRKLS